MILPASPTSADKPVAPPEQAASIEDQCQLLLAVCFVTVAGVELLLGCILLVFSILRETHVFWLNSGGYPIPLRDLVLVGYYPLLLLNVSIMMGLTCFACAKFGSPRGFLKYEILFLCAGWSLFAGSIAISANNNISNLLNERPLHYKPPEHHP